MLPGRQDPVGIPCTLIVLWLQPEFIRADSFFVTQLARKMKTIDEKVESNELVLRDAKRQAKRALKAIPAQAQFEGATEGAFKSLWDTDPHKGMFGGAPRAGGRELSAAITPVLAKETTCKIRLQVKSTDWARPLTGDVTFYLHPTYEPDKVTVQVSSAGVAEYEDVADAPFTVGATADGGETRLELDLAQVLGGTTEFYANA